MASMKFLMVSIFSFFTSSVFCQTAQLSGRLNTRDSLVSIDNIHVLLLKRDSIVAGSVTDHSGNFIIKNIPVGIYSLLIKQLGYRDDTRDSIRITSDSSIILDYPSPCRFVYAENKKPECFGGHRDNIIPIVYGLPSQKMMIKAKKGLIYLGGCMVTDCDPHYYCTIHKREL